MKIRKHFGFLILVAICLAVSGCMFTKSAEITTTKQTVKETISLSETSLSMIVGDTKELSVTAPDGKTVIWSSSDSSVVSVTNGTLTALKAGSATIKASISEDVYAECAVIVNQKEVAATLIIGKEELSLKEDSTYTLTAQALAGSEVLSGLTFTFASNNEQVARVNEAGLITAVGEGTCDISVSVTVNGKTLTATCALTVTVDYEIKLEKEDVDLSLLTVNENDVKSYQISAKAYKNDSEVTAATFTFESSDENIATVSATGLVEAKAVGQATIKVKSTVDGRNLEKTLEVTIVKTTQTSYTVSGEEYVNVMLTKAVTGYYNEQTLKLNVNPYAKGLNVTWSIDGQGATIEQLSDPRECKVIIDADSKGTTFTVKAVLEGNEDYAITYTISSYIPISSEADLWAMNTKDSTENITGNYLLTNDIVCQNNDPDNSDVKNGNNVYLKSIIGRATNYANPGQKFTGLFDGNGFTISNIKFTLNQAYCGLFGWVEGGTIKNLGVEVVEYEYSDLFSHATYNYQGAAIVGYSWGITMENCYVKTAVGLDNSTGKSTNSSGALVGYFAFWQSSINNCYTEVTAVKVYNDRAADAIYKAGAFVGVADNGNVNNSYSIVTQNEFASKVEWAGTVNDNGKTAGCIVASSAADLVAQGFTAASLPSAIWDVTINEGVASIALKKGCTCSPEANLTIVETLSVQEEKEAAISYQKSGNGTITWTSSDENIVTVDANGKVTGIAPGTATITATFGEIVKTCTVTVTAKPLVNVTEEDSYNLYLFEIDAENDKKEITLAPKFVVNKEEVTASYTYQSSDESIATVDANGKVTAIKAGTATITITGTYGEEIAAKEVTITVLYSTVESLTITASEYTNVMIDKEVAGYCNSQEVTVSIPDYKEGMKVNWTSSYSGITVTQDANDPLKAVIAYKEGSNANGSAVTITVSVEGFTGSTTFNIQYYFAITSEADLWAMNNRAWNGTNIYGQYLLTNDIVCENNDPSNSAIKNGDTSVYLKGVVGRATSYNSPGYKFSGTFDGNGFTISNLKFTLNQCYCGLFSYLDGATIRNLGVEVVDYVYASGSFDHGTFSHTSGAIAGYVWNSTITNCYCKTVVAVDCQGASTNSCGGIVGFLGQWQSKIENCYTEVTAVKVYNARPEAQIYKAGAFVGVADNGNVNNCYSVITQNDWVSNVEWAGTVNANGKNSGCIVASSASDLVTQGFTADKLSSSVWNVTINEGTASISLKKGCTFTPADSLTIDEIAMVQEGKTVTVNVTKGGVKEIVWSSSDEEIATVDANGKVTGVATGSVTITATLGDIVKTCTVTVTAKPSVSVTEEDSYQIYQFVIDETNDINEVTLAPKFIYNEEEVTASYTYQSSDESIVTVDASGKITAIKVGTATITITGTYGEETATKEVTINVGYSTVTSLEFSTGTYTELMIDKEVDGYCNSQEVTVSIPNYKEGMKVTWASSYSGITVTQDANDPLKAVIAAASTHANGNPTKVTVTVEGFEGKATYDIDYWYAVASESDLWEMNNRAWASWTDCNNAKFNAIAGRWLLVNDIVCANNDPDNTTTCGDVTVYTTAPIGRGTGYAAGKAFIGTFDGNGHKISNLKINLNAVYAGLFYYVGANGLVKDLTVEYATYEFSAAFPNGTFRKYSGGIAGRIAGTGSGRAKITGCTVKASIPVDSGDQAAASAAFVYLTENWNTEISNCTAEITLIHCYQDASLEAFNVGMIGNHKNGDLKDNKVVVTNNEYVSNFVELGDTLVNSSTGKPYGTITGNKIIGSISIDETANVYTMIEKQLTANVIGSGETIVWSSSDETIATVDENGLVTGIATGTATITATYGSISDTCIVTVTKVEIIEGTSYNLALTNGVEADHQTQQLAPVFKFDDVEQTITFAYTVADSNVATVDASGLVTAVQCGTTKVTITATYQEIEFTKEITINVVTTTALTITASEYTNVMIDKEVAGYCNSQEVSITIQEYLPTMKVNWTSSYSGITVTQDANDPLKAVIAYKEGSNANGSAVTITVSVEGFTGSATFNIQYYFAITSEADLWAMNNRAWNGTNIYGQYLLTNDIVCENNDPSNSAIKNGDTSVYLKGVVGRATSYNSPGYKFSGTFDGNGFTISNLKFTLNQCYCGLFSYLDGATIRNLGVEVADYVYASGSFDHGTFSHTSGAIAGYVWNSTITNCYCKTVVAVDCQGASTNSCGGIVGFLGQWQSKIENCYTEVTAVKVYNARPEAQIYKAGAFVGVADNGNVNNCYSVITQNDWVSNVEWAGTVNANGKTSGCIIASSSSDLVTQGFTADKLSSSVWNVTIADGAASISLKKGCTFTPVVVK